jgi:predicted homoserine dehydrogenase-like protein
MYGPEAKDVHDALELFDADELVERPIVDYLVGAEPAPGVFVLGHHDHPVQRAYLDLYKLGAGPLYVFYRPYHLCHFEVPATLARAVLFGDATVAPLDGPRVDVVAAAKRELHAGETLDGIGFFMTYGLAENAEVVAAEKLLPMGLAEGCRLARDVAKDAVLTYADVQVPAGRLCDRLRSEQAARFGAAHPDAESRVVSVPRRR